MILRAVAAIQTQADDLGVGDQGKINIRLKNRSYEVRQGRRLLGRLTQDQLTRCETEHLFRLSRAVSVDVISPLAGPGAVHKEGDPEGKISWVSWSEPIRSLGWALGQLMDMAIDEIRLASRAEDQDVAPETLAYQIITSDVNQERLREAARKVASRSGSAKWTARANFSISGATASCAGRMVFRSYKRWEKDEIGYPSWKGPRTSVPVRADTIQLRMTEDDTLVLKFAVIGGRGSHHECIVSPNGGSHWSIVRKIITGEFEHGDGRLMWDERRKKWTLSLSYSMPRQEPKAKGTGYLAVRRSVRDMLFVMDNKGGLCRDPHGIGLKIIHRKGQFLRRKKREFSLLKLQGRGAFGHGKRRRYRTIERISIMEDNAMDTMLKQLASAIRKAAERSDARVVLVEDFSLPWSPQSGDPSFLRLLRRMPWARAEGILKTELEEHGIQLKSVAQAHNTSQCPSCKHELKMVTSGKATLVDCAECGLFIHTAHAAAWNMFVAAGIDVTELAELKRKLSYQTRALRKESQAAVAAE